jgi:hypothetical protein
MYATIDTVSPAVVKELATAEPAIAVSMLVPMATTGKETAANPTALKNALREAAAALRDHDTSEDAVEQLLAPAYDLLDDHEFWQNQTPGLGVYLADGQEPRLLQLPMSIGPTITVGRRFYTGPLLDLLNADDSFLVLTATNDRARLYTATRAGMVPMTGTGLPDERADDDVENDYENPVQASPPMRPNTGHAAISNAQVYGDAPPEWRETRKHDHAHAVLSATDAATRDRTEPIVLLASAELIGMLRPSDKFRADVELNPEALSEGELHEAALAAVVDDLDAAQKRAIDDVAASLGRADGGATADRAELVSAAREGRVGTLVITRQASHSIADDLAEIIGAALSTGARLVIAEDDQAPAELCGLLRY